MGRWDEDVQLAPDMRYAGFNKLSSYDRAVIRKESERVNSGRNRKQSRKKYALIEPALDGRVARRKIALPPIDI